MVWFSISNPRNCYHKEVLAIGDLYQRPDMHKQARAEHHAKIIYSLTIYPFQFKA